MSRSNRSSPSSRKGRKPHHTREMLLPLPATTVRRRSLRFHACLTTVRAGFGNAEHLVELASVMYIAYFLQRAGYGTPPFEQFHDAEEATERANRRGAATDTWFLADDDYPLFEGILALHDRQLENAPVHAILNAEDQLARFVASDLPSPLPPRLAADIPAR